MKTLSVTLICKNEQDNLTRLLPMLKFADEIVVVDTGSTDNTLQVAKSYTDKVYDFTWCDDFSKARNYAIKQATCDYVMWLDADDVLPQTTQQALKAWKLAPDRADVYYVKYTMNSAFPFWFWRERIVKRCKQCRFKGFIHETISPFGATEYLNCEILHCPSASHERRNLRIYERALAENRRFSLRDKFYYAKTLLECGQINAALPLVLKFARNKRANSIDRVEGYAILANNALFKEQTDVALGFLAESVKLLPPNGEICCLFGQCYMQKRSYLYASQWYAYALSSNSQSGFVNEYYVKFLPNVQLSVCLWYLGDKQAAARYHNVAKSVAPNNPTVLTNEQWFCNTN